jgi:hypothetical protein
MENSYEVRLPSIGTIKILIDPICERLKSIEESLIDKNKIINEKQIKGKYYRNTHLKERFGLSNNTIIKYRETGILPFTKLGDIYLYEVKLIDKILLENEVKLNTNNYVRK